VFTNKKRESIDSFVCAVSLYISETPKASIKDHEPQLPIIPFGIVAYGFVGQPFSKQLYACARATPITVWVGSKNESNHLLENKMVSTLVWRHVILLYVVQSNILGHTI